MANRPKFGTNFTPKAVVNSTPNTTKSIAFGALNDEEKQALKEKLTNGNSLIVESSTETKEEIIKSLPDKKYTIKSVDIGLLKEAPDEWNFFTKPSKEKIAQLAESIYSNGLLQPIVIRSINPNDTEYQILAGHTRVQAYKILYDLFNDPKYLSINAIAFDFREIDNEEAQDIICDTNFMQRGTLPLRDMAKCIYLKAKRYRETKYRTDEPISERIAREYKIKKTSVFMWKRIANLTDMFQRAMEDHKISAKNAYKLSFLSAEDQAKLLASSSAIYMSNDSLKLVKAGDSVEVIEQKIIDSMSKLSKTIHYDITSDDLKNIKDAPLLVFVNPEKLEEIMDQINSIDGAHVVRYQEKPIF